MGIFNRTDWPLGGRDKIKPNNEGCELSTTNQDKTRLIMTRSMISNNESSATSNNQLTATATITKTKTNKFSQLKQQQARTLSKHHNHLKQQQLQQHQHAPLNSTNKSLFRFNHHNKIIIFTSCIALIISIYLIQITKNQEIRNSCGKCFTSGPEHAWCEQENFGDNGSRPRCDSRQNLENAGCHQIWRPEPELIVLEDNPLSNRTTSNEDDVTVQLKPQRIKLRLPPHSPKTITLQYRQPVDYPVDLYYLMDLSKSMADDKEKLAELGHKIEVNMKLITNNFRLGFGSFVDKVLMPFVSTVPKKLINPCPECTAPYGFRNHMPLTTDTSSFTDKVAASQISGNLDAPEGGFDAIMQSMVCHRDINWRAKSRKMLVFTTDASSHQAGDGKLAGVITPNDGKCHLDQHGNYTESSFQDYPTLSQIDQKAQENHVNIIFAVTENQVPTYKRLSELIEGSSTGKLDNDSSNIVQLIEQSYRDITSELELKDNATNYVQMTYHSACLGDKRKETNVCHGLKIGQTVSFDIDIEVKACPKRASEYNQTIQVYPVGLNESLLIDLEIICECDCEKPWNIVEHSPVCKGFGSLVCGICVCDPLRYGRYCECDAKESDPARDLIGCHNGNDTRICSGQGDCICGQCECRQRKNEPDLRIYGKYCECDNFSCFHHDNKICSGPDHGTCECGKCVCNKDWSGEACECRKSVDTCIDPKTQKVCAGHGECICGQCKCLQTEERSYTGQFCEECNNCPTMCEKYKDCVRCTTFETGPLTKDECKFCTNSTFTITNVTKLEVEEDETLCVFTDDDGCRYQFKYKLLPTDTPLEITHIHVLDTKDCPKPFPFFLILLALALAILLLGLLGLLLWKCLTMWKDQKEIAKFEKEKLTARWDTGENPIFKQATSTFKNPTYKH